MLVVTGVFGLLSLIVVSLRMVTRIPPFKAPFGWDDGLILTVMVSQYISSRGVFLIGVNRSPRLYCQWVIS